MEMGTTCPHCATSFRVTPDHLRARGGQVRCGKCAKVFDGFQALTTRDTRDIRDTRDTIRPVAAAPVVPAVPPLPVVPAAGEIATQAVPPIQSVEPTRVDVPIVPRVREAPGGEEPAPQIAATPVAPEIAATPEQDIYERLKPVEAVLHTPAPAMTASPTAHDYTEEGAAPIRRSGLWAFAAFVAMLALAGQAIHAYRDELASKFPELKPALAQFCEFAACKMLPLQRPGALKIEGSDLQVTDPSRPSVIQLTATLRNYSNMEIGYPALDLVLTDNREHALVRRIFSPADYLARSDALTAGIAANAEVTVRIDIDTGNLGAAGFRLNLSPAISH